MINHDWNQRFIGGVFINKRRILKSINIIFTREGVIFDDVCMIATYRTYALDDPERCAIDQVVLSMEFPGYPEETACITYDEYLQVIECGLQDVMDRYEDSEREEILQTLEKARNELGRKNELI
ncbi:hypothetical protein HPY31_18755 [Brevibacillus sp. HB1.3]|uniref:hypothetical protein n=1 Tax=Brevibacillus sp. HB1.3 TaxID=2738842 RepID=UPI001555A97D|nr:hypothetical protein [Brevibacillus sp. HB1.3]NQF15939.1 hypothetical protein [Brevibacillus sp. HB1.3]